MKLFPLFLVLLINISSRAASEAHGAHSNEIPGYVLWQVINLVILGAILYKYGKQPVRDFFNARQSTYLKEAEKSRAIFAEAEKEYADIQVRLETLISKADESISQAKIDAEEMKKQMISDARTVAARIKEEALIAAKLEGQKTTIKAKNDIVLQALMNARSVLTKDIGGQDHQKLQSDFNKNIEAVSP